MRECEWAELLAAGVEQRDEHWGIIVAVEARSWPDREGISLCAKGGASSSRVCLAAGHLSQLFECADLQNGSGKKQIGTKRASKQTASTTGPLAPSSLGKPFSACELDENAPLECLARQPEASSIWATDADCFRPVGDTRQRLALVGERIEFVGPFGAGAFSGHRLAVATSLDELS